MAFKRMFLCRSEDYGTGSGGLGFGYCCVNDCVNAVLMIVNDCDQPLT